MRFGVLGPLAVWADDGTPVAIPGAKVRVLLADLLAHSRHPVSADRLIDDLWGDDLPGNPAGALHAKVSQLRRALERAEPRGRAMVGYGAPGYTLRVDPGAVDAGRFATLVHRGRTAGDPAAAADLLADALALWRGPAFADVADEPFARPEIVRLEELRLAALEDLVEARLALGEDASLVAELGTLLTEHPLRERLYAAQMRALYRAGRQAEALSTYDRLRSRLADDLGLDPGPDLVRLRQAILEQDPSLDAVGSRGSGGGAAAVAVPPPDPRPARRTNLPTPLSDLVGRKDTAAEVRSWLDTARLVTLTGPGGVGKTRLALDVAATMADTLPDGAWIVELTSLEPSRCAETADSLAGLVAAALGVRDDAALALLPAGQRGDLLDRLAGALRTRGLLLVLDNCERVIERAAELAQRLLRAAPELRILATSREPIRLAGEHVVSVPPLDLPEPGPEGDVSALWRSSAVRLFVARAAATAPGFQLDSHNGEAVATICRRLDGLPLALELAATRVRALGVAEVAARLDDRFRLLAAGHRDAPARQRTLRAVIDWSWEPLSAAERAVLRRLAVHADGCTLAAAEAVSAGDPVDPVDTVDILARLVDRSLVVVIDGPDGARYRLLETVATYCLERLAEAGEKARISDRHARYYTELAGMAAGRLHGHDQRRWLERLDAEAANVRVALDWTVRHRNAAVALRLAGAMAWYWFLRGQHRECHRSLSRALATDGEAPAAVRAQARAWLSAITLLEFPGADPMEEARAALAGFDRVEDPAARAYATWVLGFAMHGSVELSTGEAFVDEALRSFRRLGDRWGVAAALSVRASQALVRGDLASAGGNGQEGAALFQELGDRWGQSRTADVLGALAEIDGDYARAARLHRDGLRMAEEIGLWPVASQLLSRLGRLALLAGDYPTADELHQRALHLAGSQSFTPGDAFAEVGLGLVARRRATSTAPSPTCARCSTGTPAPAISRAWRWRRRSSGSPPSSAATRRRRGGCTWTGSRRRGRAVIRAPSRSRWRASPVSTR